VTRTILERKLAKRLPKPEQPAVEVFAPKSCADVVERMVMRTGAHYSRPVHLQRYVDTLDRAVLEGDVRSTCSAPPQHGKSVVGYAALIFACIVRPGLRHFFVSYGDKRSQEARAEIEQLALACGLDPRGSADRLDLKGGSIIDFCGVGGALTGFAIDGLVIVDDPIKDDVEANNANTRQKAADWFFKVLETRVHPPSADGSRKGGSIVVTATRWHQDDLIGRLSAPGRGWPHVRLAALCDDESDGTRRKLGEALWPEQRPESWLLAKQRTNPRGFACMYQGTPTTEGDRRFGPATYYLAAPMSGGRRFGCGLDLAYSGKQTSDFSVLLGGMVVGSGSTSKVYLTHLLRRQQEATTYLGDAIEVMNAINGPCVFHTSGAADKLAAASAKQSGAKRLRSIPATADKLARLRASGALQAWNEGRILVPQLVGPQWQDFVEELEAFTGVPGVDLHDDCADALASLAVALRLSTGSSHFGVNEINAQLHGLNFGAGWQPRFPSGVDHMGRPLPARARRLGA